MADISHPTPNIWATIRKVDVAWALIVIIPLLIAVLDYDYLLPGIRFAIDAFLGTLPFIVFAVLAVGYLKATSAENLLAKAFEGREVRMIFMAALLGGLSPFCSCEVIPFIAALLAVGAPLSAVMAFWLSSPLMDPAMFAITSGTLGFEFAVAKTLSAVGLGLLGGFFVKSLAGTTWVRDPLKEVAPKSCCSCGPEQPFQGRPVWKFWGDQGRITIFKETLLENALFLGKWLALAYLIEALMVEYIPAGLIAQVLGGDGMGPIALGALVGAPAYLNGYAAVPLVNELLQQGMADGAAMSFVVAGGVSSIPAAIAVWALVKPRIFATYLGVAMVGAVIAGLIWNFVA